MAGVEIVADRKTKTPADKKLMGVILAKTAARGVMIRTMENNIILSPPLVIDGGHVEEILNALDSRCRPRDRTPSVSDEGSR